MRAVNLRFYNTRLSESRASEQNQEKPVGAGWTAYHVPLWGTCTSPCGGVWLGSPPKKIRIRTKPPGNSNPACASPASAFPLNCSSGPASAEMAAANEATLRREGSLHLRPWVGGRAAAREGSLHSRPRRPDGGGGCGGCGCGDTRQGEHGDDR